MLSRLITAAIALPGLLLRLVRDWWQRVDARHWGVQLVVALNQLANVLITPFSSGAWADETMSSRAWRTWVKGRPFGLVFRPLIDALFWWQRVPPEFQGHCHWTYEREKLKYQQPPEMRSDK